MPTEPAQKNDPSMSTRRVDPWAAYAARYACSGRKSSVKQAKRRTMVDCKCKLATSKCQEPRHHAPGKQPTDATRMSIPRMHVPTWYLVFAMYIHVCRSL